MNRRVAIFGGTFDPPHLGHLMMASNVLRAGLSDEVWLMVSPCNPFKTGKNISREEDRLEMCRLAAQDSRGISVSDFEFSLPRPSYTVDTLRALRKVYPDTEFKLVIGGDNWREFSKWREPVKVLEYASLIVCLRPGEEFPRDFRPMNPMPADWEQRVEILRGWPQVLLSSSFIRSLAAERGNIQFMVAPAVERYISEQKLYESFLQ